MLRPLSQIIVNAAQDYKDGGRSLMRREVSGGETTNDFEGEDVGKGNGDQRSTNAGTPQDDPVRSIHLRYVLFTKHLARHLRCAVETLNWLEFVTWWRTLDAKTQLRCERDFSKGYDRAVQEAAEEAVQVVRRYQLPVT